MFLCHWRSPLRVLHVVRMLGVNVFDINQLSLPTPFASVLVSVSVFMALSAVFHSKKSPDNSPLSHCFSGLISALLVLSTIYLFMRVSVSHDTILRDWLGLKHQPTSLRTYLMEIRKNVLKRDLCIHFFGTLFRKKYLTSWERLVCSIKYEVWWSNVCVKCFEREL